VKDQSTIRWGLQNG